MCVCHITVLHTFLLDILTFYDNDDNPVASTYCTYHMSGTGPGALNIISVNALSAR